MTDIADNAQAESDLHLKAALAKRLPELQLTGRCHWCNQPVPAAPFCDKECSDDWHQHRRMNGGW